MPVSPRSAPRRSVAPAAHAGAREWAEGRRYLGLDVLARCRIRPVTDTTDTTDTTDSGEEVTIPALSA